MSAIPPPVGAATPLVGPWSNSDQSTRHTVKSTTTQLVMDLDDALFNRLQSNQHHILHKHLPERTDHNYQLRPRSYNLSLSSDMDQRNFIFRQAFKDIY